MMGISLYDWVIVTLVMVICFIIGMIVMDLIQYFTRKKRRDQRRRGKK